MALFQRIRVWKADATAEFYTCIEPLLENPQIRRLDSYMQHYNYSRLRHSLDVAYWSFLITRLLQWDSRATARAGLLHDMFYRDDDAPKTFRHMREHPAEALSNARKICELNEREADIILKHMWLFTLKPPRYKEGFVVTFVDKACALREISVSIFTGTARRSVFDTLPALIYDFGE